MPGPGQLGRPGGLRGVGDLGGFVLGKQGTLSGLQGPHPVLGGQLGLQSGRHASGILLLLAEFSPLRPSASAVCRASNTSRRSACTLVSFSPTRASCNEFKWSVPRHLAGCYRSRWQSSFQRRFGRRQSPPCRRAGIGREFSGFSFGHGRVAARIFNKTLEMRGKHSDWLCAIWRDPNPQETAWRVEVQ